MRRAVPVLLAAALGLVACGSGDGDSGDGDGRAPATEGGRATAPARGGGDAGARSARPRGVRLVEVGRFDAPLFVTSAPGDRRRLYVVEQGGRVMVVRDGRTLRRPFLDLRTRVLAGGEQGLLSIAFAPDFPRSRRFYVYFTGRDAQQYVVEGRAATADRADPASAREVLRMDDSEPNHNGGLLLFGPDRLLYVGTGDGGGGDDQHGTRGNAQDLGSLLGKILRIDPRAAGGRAYTVPASNPFTRRPGARPEIYSLGLRNPWRFSFDRRTGALTIADVGQDAMEEVNVVGRDRGAGANFGWRPWEGTQRNVDEPAPGAIAPAFTAGHEDGWCSITGGYVVRDPALPALVGRYVFGDFCLGELLSARLVPGRRATARRVGRLRVPSLSSFGEDLQGRVYATSLEGPVLRLAPR
jgi:glucose/arabinose dehydrogenase